MTLKRAILGILLMAVALPAAGQGKDPLRFDEPERASDVFERPLNPAPGTEQANVELRYVVRATGARLNRRLMGPMRRDVQGVPAEPVDSFVWNGVGSTPIQGNIVIDLQPMTNTGFIQAEWTDEHGEWTYRQVRFTGPHHHASGARMGSTVTRIDSVIGEGVSHNVYLHGDTASGQPVLPTVFTYLAAWGPAYVTLNGEPFENPFEIPNPLWVGHMMTTEGVRRPDGSVRTLTGEVYNPSRADIGEAEPGDIEVHLTFHDELFPTTSSIPPFFSFFYHVMFEEVSIEIIQGDSPRRPDPPVFPLPR